MARPQSSLQQTPKALLSVIDCEDIGSRLQITRESPEFLGVTVPTKLCILWRDRMDVPSKCMIVRTVGYVGLRLRALGMIGRQE